MNKNFVLAIDQGTTGSTILVVDRQGSVQGRAYSEFTQYFPEPGWVGHDAEEIWRVTLGLIEPALKDAGIEAAELAAIGITNQRETAVVWDRETGKPIDQAIVWQCRRTASICEDIKARGLEERFRSRTGLVVDAYFSGTKIAWLLEHVEGAREKAEAGRLAFGTIDTWLLWKLTGGRVHATDYTNASRTLLYDIFEKKWDPELLESLRIPASMMPEVRRSSEVYGTTDVSLLGGAEVPVAGMAGDQQAALFGQGCTRPGMVKNTYGTGCFLLVYSGEECGLSGEGLLTTLACDPSGGVAYAIEGSVFVAGAAVQWLRDGLGLIADATETEGLATSVADSGGVYVVPAFAGLGAPYWDMDARGAVLGLTRGSGKAELVRATLESIAYQTRDVVDAMRRDTGVKISELRVDGGASQNDFLMQFQADLLGVAVDRPRMVETTALGASFLAGLAVGFWKDADELENVRATDRRFEPSMDSALRDRLLEGWKAAVARVRSS